MKKVLKFVKGHRKDGGITPSQSGDLLSPAQTPEDERFLGLDNAAGYIVDFCGKDKTLTKLHKAAWQGNLEKVKAALKKVDIDVVDRHNRTALHFAVAQGHPNIVWFLLGSNARHTVCDADGRTPLLKAVECNHKECMTLLLDRGANVNHADFSGSTSLHIAVKQGALDVATALLQKGADVGVASNSGEHPLHIAIRTQNKGMVQLLLRCEAPVNAVDRENRTPLMLAAKSGNLALAQLFFEYGAQLYVTDSNGWTAEDYALLGGHQNVASELKTLMKKDAKPVLETHTEEDEAEALKSDADTWNDSHLSDVSEAKTKGKVFLRKFSVDSEEEKKKPEDEELVESPGSGVVPPPCQPPRSWEIIEAGMIDEATADGSEPKRRSITALGSLHSRRESFTDNSNHSDGPKYTLSLNRRKDSKKCTDIKQRFSFNEEESLKSSLSDDFSLLGKKEKEEVQHMMRFKRREKKERQNRSNSGSDWDSNLSSLLESSSGKEKLASAPRMGAVAKSEDDGTLGRHDTLNEVSEVWITNAHMPAGHPPKVEEEEGEVSSSWDSGGFPEVAFPPPPTAFELGVDMAKSISYMKGISIDHAPSSVEERDVWRGAGQAHSLDRLDEKDGSEVEPAERAVSSKHHARNPSISSQKWRSVELAPQERPVNRLVDVNRRINDQLECYDQALRELAESSYAKRQDAIISTLTESKSTKVENYYSLPSSKFKTDKDFSVTGKTKVAARDYAMSLPLQFVKRPAPYLDRSSEAYMDTGSGPMSLPFTVHVPQPLKTEEVENNERLGFEEVNSKARLKEKPCTLEFAPPEGVEVENLESPMSDEQTGSDKSDRKGKRHMLLTMRDVKHAVQVTNSFKTSLDEQILSPLTKVEGEFDLSPNKLSPHPSESGAASPGDDHAFFRGDSQGPLGRQETVIERAEFRAKSSPSDSGEEPTLWLQESAVGKGEQPSSGPTSDDDPPEAKKGAARKVSASSVESSPASKTRGRRTPSAALRRLQRLGSSSDNEESVQDGKDKSGGNEGSPDVSLSSGPIEPICKDSGSDPDTSQRDATPVHHYSLKKHHKWLKERLQSENKERQQLEEVAAQLAEKAERLQYELADAKEATKSRDEIIVLLQGQLTRMESAYTKSLEESVHCRLQLTTLEQEILHLKELCSQYEEERDQKGVETTDKQTAVLVTKIRQLEEEREGISRVVVRLEQENRSLEKAGKSSGKEDGLDEPRWTERSVETSKNEVTSQLVSRQMLQRSNKDETCLKLRNSQLESQINVVNEVNKQLESKLDQLLKNRSLTSDQEINQSIIMLSNMNAEMEKQLKLLVEELNEKTSRSRSEEDQCLIHRLNDEQILLVKSYEQKLNDLGNETHVESLKKEKVVLNRTIEHLQDEICRLKQRPNADTANFRLNNQILSEGKSEDMEVVDRSEEGERNQEARSESETDILRKQVAELQAALDDARKDSSALEGQLRTLRANGRTGAEEARAARDDELAWSNLYGIKTVRHPRASKPARPKTAHTQQPPLDKDSEEFIELKVKELEQELEKAKEEILRQRLDSNFRMQAILPSLNHNSEMLQLQKKVLELESHAADDDALKFTLQTKTTEIAVGRNERRQLEFELDNLKLRMQREFVPKIDADVAKLQADLLVKRLQKAEGSAPDDGLRERFDLLARERERADLLRRRLGRQCVSWETGVGQMGPRPRPSPLTSHSLPRERTPGGQVPTAAPVLDAHTRAQLAQQLDSTIIRCRFESPDENLEASRQDSSKFNLELLKKKYLC